MELKKKILAGFDTLKCMGQANRLLNKQRRLELKNQMPDNFKEMGDMSYPPGPYLYGEDYTRRLHPEAGATLARTAVTSE